MGFKAFARSAWERFCSSVRAANDRLPPPHTLPTWLRRGIVIAAYPLEILVFFVIVVLFSLWHVVIEITRQNVDIWHGRPPRDS